MKPRLFSALLVVGMMLAGVSCSPSAAPVALTFTVVTNVPPPQSGTFLIPKLTGESLQQQTNLLQRLRNVPRHAGFEARTFSNAPPAKKSLRYLLFKPETTNAALPLVLSLHGGGPSRRFEHLLEPYAPGFAYGLGRLTAPDTQQTHPCYVVAPWSDNAAWDNDRLSLVLEILDALQREFHYDTNRVYVTGQSMGGFGTWRIIAREPGRFAAAIPICGGGEPDTAPRLTHLPIWALHGNADGVVPVSNTRNMIRALHDAGGNPIYWEYEKDTHAGTAERAYCEPQLLNWLFKQKK